MCWLQAVCALWDSQLVEINSAAENEFVQEHVAEYARRSSYMI